MATEHTTPAADDGVVDLVAALRASVEAAKARRERQEAGLPVEPIVFPKPKPRRTPAKPRSTTPAKPRKPKVVPLAKPQPSDGQPIDLVAALRASVEAAKARREAESGVQS